MKKLMSVFGAIGLSIAAVAAVNDSLLMFSTQGPDKYADGTQVLDGECYALCYVTDAAAFAIGADGKATAGGEVLLTAPVAKDGCCPNLLYVVPAAKAAELTGGSYSVYLLDTRVKAADGTVALAGVTSDGEATVASTVNGAGAVAEGGTLGAGTSGATAFNGTVVAGGAVSVATVIDQPTIKAIKVDGAKIVLTVDGLSPLADYTVSAGTTVKDLSTKVDATVKDNTFTVDAKDGSFFKVTGTRKIAQ